MAYALEETASHLKEARERSGISQRELSKLSGVPQGQISKIENGSVDLRLSSLIELARALELEVMLVPRKALPAVKAIIRSTESPLDRQAQYDRREWEKLRTTIAELRTATPGASEHREFERYLNDIRHMHASLSQGDFMKHLWDSMKVLKSAESEEARKTALQMVKSLRNQLAHASYTSKTDASQSPAYGLDEEENDDA